MRNALAELLKSVVCISCCAGTCLLGYCHGYDGSVPMALLIFAVPALGLICARIGSLTLEKKRPAGECQPVSRQGRSPDPPQASAFMTEPRQTDS